MNQCGSTMKIKGKNETCFMDSQQFETEQILQSQKYRAVANAFHKSWTCFKAICLHHSQCYISAVLLFTFFPSSNVFSCLIRATFVCRTHHHFQVSFNQATKTGVTKQGYALQHLLRTITFFPLSSLFCSTLKFSFDKSKYRSNV